MPPKEIIQRWLAQLRKKTPATVPQSLYGGTRINVLLEQKKMAEQLEESIKLAKQGGFRHNESKAERELKDLLHRNFANIDPAYFDTPEFARVDDIYDMLTNLEYDLRSAAEDVHKHPKNESVRKHYADLLIQYKQMERAFEEAVHDFYVAVKKQMVQGEKMDTLPKG